MAKTKIAILGGGMGALAAAFDITQQDPNGALYDITLYQVGWRLGGKCAVGWSCGQPNVRFEHGLHVWAGFYDNAFDLMQRCYDAMDTPPFRDWRDAFEPVDNCWVEESLNDAWQPWRQHLPPNGLTPGLGQVSSPYELWTKLLRLTSNISSTFGLLRVDRDQIGRAEFRRTAGQRTRRLREVTRRLATGEFGVSFSQREQLLTLLQSAEEDSFLEGPEEGPSEARHAAILVNMGVALLTGMLDAGALTQGFDGLDAEEWSDWMRQYGASDMTLDSALVRGFYDYVFGAPGGRRSVGAGAATRAVLRLLFTYKGSIFYAMNQTMGDFLIAPLYEVLLGRGVKFEFFHRVDELILSLDGRYIDEIRIGIQVQPIQTTYDPLVRVGQILSWPNSPVYDRLVQGGALEASGADLESLWNDWQDVDKQVLRRGQDQDFDVVVLGISVGALGTICSDLTRRLPAWRDMLSRVETTPTFAMQLWLSKSASDFGWPDPQTLVTAFAEPLTTWGDNSQLIGQEQWDGEAPLSLGYFVGNFPDLGSCPPAEQQAEAEAMAAAWRAQRLEILWPGYDDSTLMQKYVRVNINPSDRYVLSVPQSVDSRLRPDGSGVENLYLAGDWVRIGLNAGCVEQAVLGGRAAARAITGVDMNSQYDNDISTQSGSASSSIAALGFFGLMPNFGRLALAGAGSVDACCVVAYPPRGFVEKMLPLGLELGRPQPTNKGTWPIVLMFARHKGVRPGIAPAIGGLSYDEFLIIVPSVYHTDRQPFHGPFCYMPIILLDSLLPLVVGAGFYGLKKRNARILARADSFDIRFDAGEVAASLSNDGLPGMIQDFPVLTGSVRKMFEQVIVGETTSGSWVYSYLEHNLDAAEFQPIEGKVRGVGKTLFEFSFDGIPPAGTPAAVERDQAGDIIPAPVGFRLLTKWQLTYPIVSGRYDPPQTQPSVKAFASAMTERVLNRLPSFGKFPFR
jgi:uncharacterized protein with NAD-binding domain and iron-sulfur cluster